MIEPSKRMIRCASCGHRHRIGKLDAIATHYYVQPSGCTDGDYWLEGEWHFVCPKTYVRNRLLFFASYEERQARVDAEGEFKRLFRDAFKSMTQEHVDTGKRRYQWVNNEHINKNRSAWGLPEWVPAVPGHVR